MTVASITVRGLAISVLLLAGTPSLLAQANSKPTAVGMMATVLPNLKLEPRVLALHDGNVSARVLQQGQDQFLVHARITGKNKGILQIPVWLSSNVREFTVSASTNDVVVGTVQMLSGGSEKISLFSSEKPLQSSATFALGLPGAGRSSASGTLNAVVQIALAELAEGETKEVRIRLNISQHGAAR